MISALGKKNNMKNLIIIQFISLLINVCFAEEFDFLYDKGGQIRIRDGATWFIFNRNGEYHYSVGPNSLGGFQSVGKWKRENELLVLIGDWVATNAVTPKETKRLFKIYIGIISPDDGIYMGDGNFIGWHYFSSVKDIE